MALKIYTEDGQKVSAETFVIIRFFIKHNNLSALTTSLDVLSFVPF